MSEIIDCISWIVQKTCWSFYVFLKFLLLRFLDLLGLIFNVAACLTIIRFPMMIRQFADMDDLEEWRYVGLVQFLIFIVDIPVMIAAAILVLTVFRMFPLCKELKENNCEWDISKQSHEIYFSGFKTRKIIMKQFFLLLVDLLFIPAALLCLLSWRCVIFIRAFKEASDQWEKRKTCFKQLLYLFLDIPCIILGLICMCTWRMPVIVYRWYKAYRDGTETEWDTEKWYAFYHFGLLLIDIPCIVCFLVASVTWRLPFMIRKLTKISMFDEDDEWKLRKLAVAQFFLIFIDIPCILCSLFVFVTIWRFPAFVRTVTSALRKKSGRQWKVRRAAVVQFFIFFIDVTCFLLCSIIIVTLWRLKPLLQGIKKALSSKHKSKDEETMKVDVEGTAEAGAGEQLEINVDQGASSVNDPPATAEGNLKDLEDSQKEVTVSEAGQDESNLDASTESAKKKLHMGWKIRKVICIQFASLLIDIPALALLLFLIVTILRLPKLLSTFLQSGDFYTEFALTVYYQTFLLFADLFFALLFLLLMFLRPLQSWICLLEDEDHMKYRLLRHHMQWIPDIIAKRKPAYQQANELLSIHLKMFSTSYLFKNSVKHCLDEFIDELKEIRNKLKDQDLDPDYVHLLDSVLWWEDKRIDKMLRFYVCEYNYLCRPDRQVHKRNLETLRRELDIYDAKVDEQYDQLKEFFPTQAPLWTVSTGLSLRSRKETQKVLIDCLPRGDIFLVLLALLCCVPIYRGLSMVKKLYNRWYNRSNIILRTIKEYSLDLLTLCRIIVVIIFIYRAPFLVADILIDIVDKKSWKAVRRTVKKYPLYIWEDLINMIQTLLSWKTPRFIVTSILFGILMPADIFLTTAKTLTTNMCIAYTITGIIYLTMIGLPFLISFYLGSRLLEIGIGWVSAGVSCGFVAALLLVLAVMVTAYVKKNRDTKLVPQIHDYFHWNWYNFHVIAMELLEFLQSNALVFSYVGIPMYGGPLLHEASNYLLLSFFPFNVKLWIAFVLFFIWFFLSAAPVIFEQILEDLPKGTCDKHPGWKMAVSLFANTLFITFIECFLSCISCSYVKCPSDVNYKILPTNHTCFRAYLADDNSLLCWEGQHRMIALFGLFGLVWYTSTSFLVAIQYGDPGITKQDVEFSPTYNVIQNFVKAAMIAAVVVITTNKFAGLGILIAGNGLMVIFTVLFKTYFHYKPTNSLSFLSWRVAAYSSSVCAAVAVTVAFATNKQNNKLPVIIFGVGTFISVFVAAVVSVMLRKKDRLESVRQKFRERLSALEKRLLKDNMLLSSWREQQKAWRHLLRGVREARRDDQLFQAADWEALVPKDVEPTVLDTETETDLDGQTHVDMQTTEVATLSPDQKPENVLISTDLPPPPSYGSVTDDVVDAPSFFADRVYFGEQEVIKESPFDNPLLSLERNGVNLLLVLEQSILYKAYSFSFFAQRSIWLSSVVVSNWTGLMHCLEVLESNLDFSFNLPSTLDISIAGKSVSTDVLDDDPRDQEEPPSYIPESRDPAEIEALSTRLRLKALGDVESIQEHGSKWKELMDKLLPTLPVIRNWSFDKDSGDFEVKLRRNVTGTIKSVGLKGAKLARGANISLGKVTKGNLALGKIQFLDEYQPKGSKGPIQVNVADIQFIWKKNQWYLESQGKSVKYDVALDSMQVLEWR